MQQYCTGPARVWIQFPVSGVYYAGQTPQFGPPEPFCTCERAPEPIEDVAVEEVPNDLGGTRKPFDLMHQGTDAILGGITNRYRESIYRLLAETPRYVGTGIRGDALGDIGTLYMLEGRALIVILEYVYGGGGPSATPGAFPKQVHVNGSMPGGLRFLNCVWKGPTRHRVGTSPKAIQFLFQCARLYNPDTGSFSVADENISAISGLPWEVTP